MPKQEVAFVRTPATLLSQRGVERPMLLDGNGPDSWGDGRAFFAANPVETLEISADAAPASRPLEILQDFVDQHLAAGCVGVLVTLAYDLKHWVERLERRLPWRPTPVVYAAAFEWAYVADHSGRSASLVGSDPRSLQRGRELIGHDPIQRDRPRLPPLEASMSREAYLEMIARTKEYIAAGDIYQANMSQEFRCAMRRDDAPALFEQWTRSFPTPWAAYVDGGPWALLSNSPECLLDIRGDRIATYPIKGTRSRREGDDVAAIESELSSDPKERAEHVMIVDLERNDLGRLCLPGSVFVPEMQETRRFPLLVHMVSRVSGTLREGVGLAEILRATFPGGSITGAPKVRAMEIIEELEPVPRGFYTGSIGWIEPGGRARFNIAIRTAQIDEHGLSFHAGGGIVADSNPDREYAETFAKSRSLFRVLAESADGAD